MKSQITKFLKYRTLDEWELSGFLFTLSDEEKIRQVELLNQVSDYLISLDIEYSDVHVLAYPFICRVSSNASKIRVNDKIDVNDCIKSFIDTFNDLSPNFKDIKVKLPSIDIEIMVLAAISDNYVQNLKKNKKD